MHGSTVPMVYACASENVLVFQHGDAGDATTTTASGSKDRCRQGKAKMPRDREKALSSSPAASI